MTDYLIGDTVVLQATYYSENEALLDPDATPSCEVHDSRGRAVQTNLPVTKVSTGTYQADYNTSALIKGTYTFIFTALFDGAPSKRKGDFTLVTG